MCLRYISLFIPAIGLSGSVLAGETAKKPNDAQPDVPLLVRQLGSDRYAEREAATAAIDSLGSITLEHLKKARRSSDPEVQRRVADLLVKIEARVESIRILQPKRIRLVYTNIPLTKAVEDFARRTGVTLNLGGDAQKNEKRLLTLDTGDVTFWEAMDLFCQKAGLIENEPTAMPDNQNLNNQWGRQMMFRRGWIDYGYRPTIQQSPITLQDGKPNAMPCCYAGAVRIRALPPGFPKNGSAVSAQDDEVVLNIEVTHEPRLGWQGLRSMRIDKVIGDKGEEATAPAPYIADDDSMMDGDIRFGGFNSYYGGRADNGSGSRYVSMRVKKPLDKSKSLKLVQGKITAEVLSPLEPLIVVNDIMQASGENFPGDHGGCVKVVEVAKGEGETLKVRVVVESPPRNTNGQIFLGGGGMFIQQNGEGDAEATDHYLAHIDRELSVIDSKGRHLKLIEANTNDQDNVANPTKEYHLTYDLPAGSPKPAKLVYNGQRVVMVDVNFTLKDVPLP
ncbi:MAG: HEAT repeat domain-containing protein [Gemmataceae bacterium]